MSTGEEKREVYVSVWGGGGSLTLQLKHYKQTNKQKKNTQISNPWDKNGADLSGILRDLVGGGGGRGDMTEPGRFWITSLGLLLALQPKYEDFPFGH